MMSSKWNFQQMERQNLVHWSDTNNFFEQWGVVDIHSDSNWSQQFKVFQHGNIFH